MKTNLLILLASLSVAFAQQPPAPTDPAPPVPPTPPEAFTRAPKPSPPAPVVGDPFVRGPASAPKPLPKLDAGPQQINYQVLLETFDVSRDTFVTLLDEPGDDGARYGRIVAWMKAGRAKLVNLTAITARSGNRTVVESIDEVRYAIELNSPKAEEDFAFPTTFETRNAGDTLELELVVDPDGNTANMQIAPQVTRLVRFTDEIAHQGRPNSAISQPRFETRKFTTNLFLAMNQPRLAGTLSVADDNGATTDQVRVCFITVRPNLLALPKTAAAAPAPSQIRLEYTFFSLERTAARELWLAKPDPQSCFDALRTLAAEKKATLEHSSINVTLSANRIAAQETQEIKYGIEFVGPRMPGQAEEISQRKTARPAPRKPEDPSTNLTASTEVQLTPAAWPKKSTIPAHYSTFEIRNAGFSSESEPVLSPDGSFVDMQVFLQFVRNVGALQVTGIGKDYPLQPLFETRKVTGTFSAPVGQQQFISTFNMPNESGANGRKDDGRVWLGFVRPVVVR